MVKSKQNLSTLARAKINLTLHVGQRGGLGSGYPPPRIQLPAGKLHPVYSLVVFADIGDMLTAQIANEFSLEIDGPFKGDLSSGADNLVIRTAMDNALFNAIQIKLAYRLTKNLPVSSGIGGGSADAGAAVRLLAILNNEPPLMNDYMLVESGADVPVCHLSQTCLMEGIGENLTPLPNLGQLPAILVNPGVAVSTGEIFNAFDVHGKSSGFNLKGETLLEMAKSGTNDLQDIAIKIAPVIQTVLNEISTQDGCELARMSGSGATCFGVFGSIEDAENAANLIKKKYPNWWCVPATLGDNTN